MIISPLTRGRKPARHASRACEALRAGEGVNSPIGEYKMATKLYNLGDQKNIRKKLRQEMPKSEVVLWQKLRANQFKYKFRRQYGISKYIIDFYCPVLKLAIEIDGGTHEYRKQVKYDEQRQKYLEELGIKVIRLNSKEVLENLDNVINQIYYQFEKLND